MRGGLSGFLIFIVCIALGVAAIGGVNSVARAITAGVAEPGADAARRRHRASSSTSARRQTGTRLPRRPRRGGGQRRHALDGAAGGRLRPGAGRGEGRRRGLSALRRAGDEPALPPTIFSASAAASTARRRRTCCSSGWACRWATASARRRDLRIARQNRHRARRRIRRVRLRAAPDGVARRPARLRAYPARQPRRACLQDHAAGRHQRARSSPRSANAPAKISPRPAGAIRTRTNAAPALSSNIERFSQFLTLVGLTALVVGGVGVANAVRAYLDGKRGVIATLQEPRRLRRLRLHRLSRPDPDHRRHRHRHRPGRRRADAVRRRARRFVLHPGPGRPRLYPGALALAALFGVMVTLAFALLPLGRARDVPATALFRELGFEGRGAGRAGPMSSRRLADRRGAGCRHRDLDGGDRRIAWIFVGAASSPSSCCAASAPLVQAMAAPQPARPLDRARLAIGNIHRPGALTPSVVLSLGLGLTLLVTLALIDGNLRARSPACLPERAPNFFFVDIQSRRGRRFASLVAEGAGGDSDARADAARPGHGDQRRSTCEEIDVPPEGAWVLRGDRGITYSETCPRTPRCPGRMVAGGLFGRAAGLLFGRGGQGSSG
jgi:putative ABC transport system permease protein